MRFVVDGQRCFVFILANIHSIFYRIIGIFVSQLSNGVEEVFPAFLFSYLLQFFNLPLSVPILFDGHFDHVQTDIGHHELLFENQLTKLLKVSYSFFEKLSGFLFVR